MAEGEVHLIRIGHRSARDVRITTHVCLVARALGAGSAVVCGEAANDIVESVRKISEAWGGPFSARYEKAWRKAIMDAKKAGYTLVHLTMYGERVQDKIEEVRKAAKGGKLAVIVGAEQVPGEVYHLADFNVAVTNQPHSEVAALAIFLDKYFKGSELDAEFRGAKLKIVPSARGKKVI